MNIANVVQIIGQDMKKRNLVICSRNLLRPIQFDSGFVWPRVLAPMHISVHEYVLSVLHRSFVIETTFLSWVDAIVNTMKNGQARDFPSVRPNTKYCAFKNAIFVVYDHRYITFDEFKNIPGAPVCTQFINRVFEPALEIPQRNRPDTLNGIFAKLHVSKDAKHEGDRKPMDTPEPTKDLGTSYYRLVGIPGYGEDDDTPTEDVGSSSSSYGLLEDMETPDYDSM